MTETRTSRNFQQQFSCSQEGCNHRSDVEEPKSYVVWHDSGAKERIDEVREVSFEGNSVLFVSDAGCTAFRLDDVFLVTCVNGPAPPCY